MNPKSLFSVGLVLLLGGGLFQQFKPELPEARADEPVALIQTGETEPMLPKPEASSILADFSPYLWHTFYGGESWGYGTSIAKAEDGSVYIAGTSHTSWLGEGGAEPLHPSNPVPGLYDSDLFVLKLDSEGAYQWHTFYGGGWDDHGFDITAGGDGCVYITGSSGSWLGDGDAEPLHPHSGDSDLFVLKLGIFPLVTLDSTPNPSDFGQVVTFTTTVTPTASHIPTGMVTFTDGLTVLGSGVLNTSGVAVLETPALAVGEHTITVKYGGDDQFTASSSPSPLVHTVQEIDQTRHTYLPLLSR